MRKTKSGAKKRAPKKPVTKKPAEETGCEESQMAPLMVPVTNLVVGQFVCRDGKPAEIIQISGAQDGDLKIKTRGHKDPMIVGRDDSVRVPGVGEQE